MSAKDTWFDDPEWDDLRKKTNKKGKAAHTAQPNNSQIDDFLHKPTSNDLRHAVNRRPSAVSSKPSLRQSASAEQKESFSIKPTAKVQSDAYEKPRDNRPVQVSINVSLPTMDTFEPLVRPIKRLKQIRIPRAYLKIAGAMTVIALIGFAGYKVLPGFINKEEDSQVLASKTEKPTYDVTKPDNVNAANGEVKFDAEKQVASFSDTVGGVKVTVSQQPMPENFKSNPYGELEKLATSFSATESFAVNDFKVFIGTSAKGPQSLILIKDKKLIFIYAERKLPNTEWVKYIETLRT